MYSDTTVLHLCHRAFQVVPRGYKCIKDRDGKIAGVIETPCYIFEYLRDAAQPTGIFDASDKLIMGNRTLILRLCHGGSNENPDNR